MRVEKGAFVMVRVPDGKEPRHGWNPDIPNFALGFADAPADSYTTLYCENRKRGSHDNKELVVIKHPFVATFASLGRGVATAVFDAASKEEAKKIVSEFVSTKDAKDVASRTIKQLSWIDTQTDLNPVLLSIEDKKPTLEKLRAVLWKGRG